MAKAAVIDSSSAASILPLGRHQSGLKMKRKTPSELRGEQLKRKNGVILSDEKIAKMLLSESGLDSGVKKPESVKAPRYIDTRVNDVYPVRKSSERFRVLHGDDRVKQDAVSNGVMASGLDNPFMAENFSSENMTSLLRWKVGASTNLESSNSFSKVTDDQGFRKIEKCSQSALRNVIEIHLGDEKPLDSSKVDMEKALKGLVARDKSSMLGSLSCASSKNYDLPSAYTRKISTEFHISGHRAPLDFTLKTTLRLISSSSVKWCHKVNATPAFFEIDQHASKYLFNMDQQSACTSGYTTTEVMYSKAMHSWAFPQSSLPSSIIIAMTLSATKGETDFLLQRQQVWEDSFRNLYYMLRKNICSMFYVHTSQFIVLFIHNKSLGKRQSCNAYLSQSSRGLRSLFRSHGVCFSMPFCHVEVEHANEADLAELSEIEQQNLGQAYHKDSISSVDNSPQSLLAFIGNTNVHGLYDFLLNYRSFLKSLNGVDVPTLYAPVPFPNASLCIPEVKCRELKKADAVMDSNASLSPSESPTCYSIEVKDTVLPPWVICRLCAAMSANGNTFESIFTTEPLSTGLNIALESFFQKKPDQPGNSDASMPESGDALGLPEASLAPCLQAASLRRLNYCNGSYIAHVTQI